jgi:hypothetical protein
MNAHPISKAHKEQIIVHYKKNLNIDTLPINKVTHLDHIGL